MYLPTVPAILLNGEPHELAPDAAERTITRLLDTLGLKPQQVAVERNREIVPRASYPETTLEDGDQLEIVTFVGGG